MSTQNTVDAATSLTHRRQRINVGIVGMGKMGQIRLNALKGSHLGHVAAIADEDSAALSRIVGPRKAAHAEEVVDDPSIEAVFICTPNHLNKPLTIRALERGKHVFCEKPPAFTAGDVADIMRAEAAAGTKLMYGFNHRHHESIKHAQALVESGSYGRILWMRGRYGKSVDHSFYNNWRSKRSLAGGGIMMDQGIHMLDLFLMLAGDFDEVQSLVSNLYWQLDVEDNVFATFRNRDGVVASLHSTMTHWRHLFSLEIFLEKGYIVINGLLTPSGTYGAEAMTIAKNRTTAPAATWSDEEHVTFEVDNSWACEVDHFLTAIDRGTPVAVGHSRDALKLMRLMDRIYDRGGIARA